jgi:ABC-type transport system substrate-binding protein
MKSLAGAVSALALLAAAAPAALAQDAAAPKQGGRMVVTYKDDVSTLDPAIGYDWQNWSIIKSLYDGLMDYKPGTTELVPDLALSYDIAPDGQAYTFRLRRGVKFHNGRELAAEDVKYSIERAMNPATQSPGAGFFGSIAAIEAPDPATVVFRLNRPDATFLHVMAINFAFAVPKEEAEKHGPDFGRNPVGTGAFRMREWTLGQRLVLERNREYRTPGLPRLDEVVFEFGQEPLVALLRFQRGEVDMLGDQVPPAKFLEVRNSPEYADNLVVGDQLHTGYVAMNVTMPPFDRPEVRRAVNHAINKERVVRVINGRARPATQPLPPAMPGYAGDYAGYAHDPAKAKELLAQAGLADGFDTVLFANNTDPNPRIAQAIQQDLAAVGIRAELKTLAQANVIAAGGDRAGAPMIWSGGMAWIADFPDPSNFYGPILGCGGAVPGGWNWSWYCNEALDAKAAQADAITDPARAGERLGLWREIFLGVMEDAPWAPVFNEQRFTLKSDRLGGPDAIFVDPVHIPVHYDEVFAKDAQ